MSTSNTVWVAVATHPNAEGQAVQNLKRQGYECYCPCTCLQRRHARRRVASRYTLATMIEAYRALYRESTPSRAARDDGSGNPPEPLDNTARVRK